MRTRSRTFSASSPGSPPYALEIEDAFGSPVWRAKKLRIRDGAAGLGLTVAKRLSRLMGGDLTVRSELGTGSVFFLWLPAAAEEAIDSSLSRSDEMDAPGPGLLQDVRDAILVELERTLHVYVARLRSDPASPSAHALSEAELEDHLATFLSDLAATFSSLDLAAGGDGDALRDGTRRLPGCHSEGGAALHLPVPGTLAPTEESALCCS
jgi:hypothetical protein